MCSQKDDARFNTFLIKSVSSLAFSCYIFHVFLKNLEELKMYQMKSINYMDYLKRFSIPITISLILTGYRFFSIKKELDQKYTAIYLKSKGKL